jgi:hypothetical protein
MMKKPRVTLRIAGVNFDPDEITRVTHISPDHIHKAGVRSSPIISAPIYKHNMWSIKAQTKKSVKLSDSISDILQRILPYKDFIYELSKQNSVDFYCVIYSENSIVLPHELIMGASSIGAAIGITFENF